jgi:hypothetical protein
MNPAPIQKPGARFWIAESDSTAAHRAYVAELDPAGITGAVLD